VYQRARVVGGQRFGEFVEVTAEGVGEGLCDPPRMGVRHREVAHRVVVSGRRYRLYPALFVLLADPAQYRVDEASRSTATTGSDQVHGGGDRGVWRHPGPQQLVAAQPQRVQQLAIDLREWAVRAGLQHRIQQTLRAACSVAQFGGQRGVAAVDPALPQQAGQHQIGVRVTLAHRSQSVQRRLPRPVIHRWPGRPGAPPGGPRTRRSGRLARHSHGSTRAVAITRTAPQAPVGHRGPSPGQASLACLAR
jgi:hypothetical protein